MAEPKEGGMSQEELDRRMLENFIAGLKRSGRPGRVEDALAGGAGDHRLLMVEAACHAVMAARARRWVGEVCKYLGRPSPLEAVLELAVMVEAEHRTEGPVLWACCQDKVHREDRPTALSQVGICRQHQVGVYRVDLFVAGYELDEDYTSYVTRGRVAVEVDGHEFHEKTKEQAQHDKARDRELQRCGLTVFRFTGSEVFRDPFAVAAEVIEHALNPRPPEPE